MKTRRVEHGGETARGRRKVARPISTREPMYLVLRSTRAKGRLSLTRPELTVKIRAIIGKQSESCRVRVLQVEIESDSLHLLIRVSSRAAYLRFIRSVTGLVSRQVTGAQRGPKTPLNGDARGEKKANGSAKAPIGKGVLGKNGARKAAANGYGDGNGKAMAKGRATRFWDVLPYSRIATGCSSIRAAQELLEIPVRQELKLNGGRTQRRAASR